MALDLALAEAIDLGAAVALASLGLVVAVLRPRKPAALSFASFCLTLAAIYLLLIFPAPALLDLAFMLAVSASVVATVALVPRRVERRDARAVLVFFATAAVFALAWSDWTSDSPIYALAEVLFNSAVTGAAAAFPMRFAREREPAARRTLALLAVGFMLFGAGEFADPGEGMERPELAVLTLFFGLPVLLWLWATRLEGGRTARNVALALPTIALAAMILGTRAPDLGYPVMRLSAVALLAYAVMRGEIAGLDIKVRFAISKGSVAAVFVVVFFLASELAQQFFAQRFSAYVGILAAGMLVFALAPLQRVAERFAERAVPLSDAPRAPGGAEIYKAAVRAAMRDGVLTRREERHLAEVARGLGLDPVQAHELMVEVEAGR